MLSTIVIAAVFLGLMLASVVLWAFLLRLGLQWAKVPDATVRRVVFATAIVIALQLALQILVLFISPSTDPRSIVLGLVQFVAGVAISSAVIGVVFQTRFVRAIQAWLPTLLANVTTLAFVFLVLRPFVYEAFVVPTNAMAPTLVGRHWKGTCSECGKPNYCTPRDERYETAESPPMICEDFHVTRASDIDKTAHAGDRFMVAKLLAPRRWDLVVFQDPEKPSMLYVKRLVGLPGEKVHVQDGAVWIDGQRQTPPDSIRGIEYLSKLPDGLGPDLWGSETRPALLGQDEYFVLGDFSAQSRDSRLWERGAPGHNPFAVPESHMKGVVTHTYWPPHRWRIHR